MASSPTSSPTDPGYVTVFVDEEYGDDDDDDDATITSDRGITVRFRNPGARSNDWIAVYDAVMAEPGGLPVGAEDWAFGE